MNLFTFSRRALVIGILVTTVIVAGVGVIGWQYRIGLDYKGTSITGNQITETEHLVALARIENDVKLYTIDLDSVRRRIESDAWVETAAVHRSASGRINIRVSERTPAAVVMLNGRPNHFVDSNGFRIPFSPDLAFDLPVLTGNVGYFNADPPEQRISDPSLREMLVALVQVDSRTLSLVSEIEVEPSGSIMIHTTPIAGRGSIPVSLGDHDFERKLVRLAAFWEQVLLKQPEETIETIDLRYDNLIATT